MRVSHSLEKDWKKYFRTSPPVSGFNSGRHNFTSPVTRIVKMTKGIGKKKIDIKKIASDSSRKVTFSKRRTGLFKKARELETKSGARIALLVFSPSGRLYTSGDVSLFENNGFSPNPHLSTEIASNSYVKPSTLRLKNFNVEGCSEIFSPASVFYSAGEIPIVEDNLKNNGFSSNSDLSSDFSSNFYEDWSTLWLENFDDEECSEIFSPPGGFYSSGEFPIVVDDLKNNGFSSNSDLLTEISSNSYAKPSTLHLKNFNVEGCSEIFSPDGRFYSSNEFPIVDDSLKNNVFSSNSDFSPSYEDWSTLWLENFNVEECRSVEELMLLKEKLEENRDELILKMEAEFIDSLLV